VVVVFQVPEWAYPYGAISILLASEILGVVLAYFVLFALFGGNGLRKSCDTGQRLKPFPKKQKQAEEP